MGLPFMYPLHSSACVPVLLPFQYIRFPMRQFLKFMLASMLGSLLLGIVLLMLFFGAIAAIGSKFNLEQKQRAWLMAPCCTCNWTSPLWTVAKRTS
jgi:hypothetical protein